MGKSMPKIKETAKQKKLAKNENKNEIFTNSMINNPFGMCIRRA